jgi:hypothetical protein
MVKFIVKKIILIGFVLFFGIAIFSCKKISNPAPGPPVISFMDFSVRSFEPKPDAYFHFGFTDPDGDIGLKNSDTTGSFAYSSPYYYDFHMRIFKFDSATQVFVVDTVVYQGLTYGVWNYRIPYIDNQSKDKSLSGEVYVEMVGFRYSSTKKRFKYEFYIYDRAHHKSNVVTTPEFNYP